MQVSRMDVMRTVLKIIGTAWAQAAPIIPPVKIWQTNNLKTLTLKLDFPDFILPRSIFPHIKAAIPGPVPSNGIKEQIPVTNAAIERSLGFS